MIFVSEPMLVAAPIDTRSHAAQCTVFRLHPEPTKIYTWWSYRAMDNWKTADRGRRLDHVWVSPQLGDRVSRIDIAKHARGWERPSDHVPVTAAIEV